MNGEEEKSYWNLDDPKVTFRGPRKARGKKTEAPSTSAPETGGPSSSTLPPSSSTKIPVISLAPSQMPFPAPVSIGPTDFIFTPQMLHSMLQSIHRGQSIIMQSLQGLGLPSVMSMDEFEAQVTWLGDQPSSYGEGRASTAQEPVTEEPLIVAAVEDEDELTPPEPLDFNTGTYMAQEEEATPEQIPEPSPALAHAPDDATPVVVPEQTIQDSLAAPTLDFNEDQP